MASGEREPHGRPTSGRKPLVGTVGSWDNFLVSETREGCHSDTPARPQPRDWRSGRFAASARRSRSRVDVGDFDGGTVLLWHDEPVDKIAIGSPVRAHLQYRALKSAIQPWRPPPDSTRSSAEPVAPRAGRRPSAPPRGHDCRRHSRGSPPDPGRACPASVSPYGRQAPCPCGTPRPAAASTVTWP